MITDQLLLLDLVTCLAMETPFQATIPMTMMLGRVDIQHDLWVVKSMFRSELLTMYGSDGNGDNITAQRL